MHTVTKVLIVVNLVLCLVLSQFVWISLAGNVQWREKYEIERAARHGDKNMLEQAYDELLAVRAANQQRTSENSIELASLSATRQALEAWRLEAELAARDAEAVANEFEVAIAPNNDIQRDFEQQVIRGLEQNAQQLANRKADLLRERGDELYRVAQAHNTYAEKSESFRRLEHLHFLQSEELERRLDTQARYRWLRPDVQKELGDNGPTIFAQVSWADGGSLQLNKGRRDGVQRHQKFTITRNGRTIAVVDVLDVQNETCECVVIDLVSPDVKPMAGDEAVTRLFMARMGR